jgi:hypothetical protein
MILLRLLEWRQAIKNLNKNKRKIQLKNLSKFINMKKQIYIIFRSKQINLFTDRRYDLNKVWHSKLLQMSWARL